MKVLITGSNGFVAKNLAWKLLEKNTIDVLLYNRENSIEDLYLMLDKADFVFHLAGTNRPKNEEEFTTGNVDLTKLICDKLLSLNKKTPILYTSSTQALLDNAYGKSKKEAEEVIQNYSKESSAKSFIYRLPNVFGKWCRPNYNSAVATFCYNIANDLPITINNKDAALELVYVDDVVSAFSEVLAHNEFKEVSTVYKTTVGQMSDLLYSFKESRNSHIVENVGHGFERALYSTYISYFTPNQFAYSLTKHEDPRGVFVEMLKTKDAGQFSFFTAHPGITRGGHYHHSKNEKFLVIKGKAKFGFRNIISNERYYLETSGDEPLVVETVPGWTHDITNVGSDEMIVMLWANEIFDRNNPDTFASKV